MRKQKMYMRVTCAVYLIPKAHTRPFTIETPINFNIIYGELVAYT